MIIERGEFKGNKVIIFKKTEDDKYPFSIGVKKAKVFLENIDEIQAFVDENENPTFEKKTMNKAADTEDDLKF